MSSFQSNPLMKKGNSFYSVNEESKQTVFETPLLHFSTLVQLEHQHISKTPTRGRTVFFSTWFHDFILGNRFLLFEKVSFGSHERKIILKKLWSKWKCACNKLLSVGLFSRENGHVVNHSRVFLSWRWPNRNSEGRSSCTQAMRLGWSAWLTPNIIFNC